MLYSLLFFGLLIGGAIGISIVIVNWTGLSNWFALPIGVAASIVLFIVIPYWSLRYVEYRRRKQGHPDYRHRHRRSP